MTRRTGDERFAAFDIALKRRGRGRWKWYVRTTDGQTVMCGSEYSRGGARYKAQRALFLLLRAGALGIFGGEQNASGVVRRGHPKPRGAGVSEISRTMREGRSGRARPIDPPASS